MTPRLPALTCIPSPNGRVPPEWFPGFGSGVRGAASLCVVFLVAAELRMVLRSVSYIAPACDTAFIGDSLAYDVVRTSRFFPSESQSSWTVVSGTAVRLQEVR